MLPLTRRELLAKCGVGMGLLGLHPLLAADNQDVRPTTAPDPVAPLARTTSTSSVGLPRLSRISRAWMS